MIYACDAPGGNSSSAIQIIGIILLGVGMGLGNAGVYKWIPKVAFLSIAYVLFFLKKKFILELFLKKKVSGMVGAFGGCGGFIYPSFILSPIG